MDKLLRLDLLCLLLIAIFDPADLVTHMKVPLFVIAWLILVVDTIFLGGQTFKVPSGLLRYTLVFSVIVPLTSIAVYVLRGGGIENYDGLSAFKAYLFLTLAIPLAAKRIDLIRPLCWILSFLSLATIVIYSLTVNDAALRQGIYLVGSTYGLLAFSARNYGTVSFITVYFPTSPLLVIAVAYFSYRCITTRGRRRFGALMLLALNIAGMLFSGTRNNIFAAMITPLMVLFWYKRPKKQYVWRVVAVATALIAVSLTFSAVQAMFSSEDSSNAIRLITLQDYERMLGHAPTLLFGQGLGSRFYSTARGEYLSVTELTYLDIVRSYGLVGAIFVLGLLSYPLRVLRVRAFSECHYLLLAYLSYLVLCLTNPFLFSSSGMLFLALVTYKVFVVTGGSTKAARVDGSHDMSSQLSPGSLESGVA
jgi:hypothetical protein